MSQRPSPAVALTLAASGLADQLSPKWDRYHLRYFGDPILKERAERVGAEVDSALILALVTLVRREQGLGAAAQQVGGRERVCVAILGKVETVLVNPRILDRSPETVICPREGCLSVPGFRTNVRRHTWVLLEYEEAGTRKVRRSRFEGQDAQVIQHETDHLEGVCIADRVPRPQRREAERCVAAARLRA